MRSLRPFLFLAVMALFAQPLTACSDDDDSKTDISDDAGSTDADATGGDDADTQSDDADGAGGEDVTEDVGADASDGGDDVDTTEEADGADAVEPGLPQTCEGACAETALTLEYAGETGVLTRAAFGLTAPNATESGEWEVYLEAWEGGFEGCPTESSPSPDWTFIIGGFGLVEDTTMLTKADDGVFLTLSDYDGKFLGQVPFASAGVVAITPVASKIDTELVLQGQQDEDGFLALDISAVFDGQGETSGQIYAKHCVSMDLLQ